MPQLAADGGRVNDAKVVNQLFLQRRKEALSDGVVPAVALSAHALLGSDAPAQLAARLRVSASSSNTSPSDDGALVWQLHPALVLGC